MVTQILNKVIDLNSRETVIMVEEVLKFIIDRDDQKRAFEFADLIETRLKKVGNNGKMPNKKIRNYYQDLVIRAQFIALPLLKNEKVYELISRHFIEQFNIYSYDIKEKLDRKLINIEVYEDRDKFKQQLKNAMLNNNEIITGNLSLNSISDWLRDYNAKLGIKPVNNLKKVQYLTDLDKMEGISATDKKKLQVLFDFYELLKLSTMSPEGFEEEVPIVFKGKLNIFKRGILEPINEPVKKFSGPPRTEEEGKIDELKTEEKKYAKGGLEERAIEEEINQEKRIEELRVEANKYQAGSLERKAFLEEIEKLKKL